VARERATVCVVGSGTRFVSGISYYTHRLASELAAAHPVAVVLMRQLLPTFLYPGRDRVGTELTTFSYPPGVRVFDGVDWFWIPSLLRALAFLRRERPRVLVLQWWTGTVLHSYLVLATVARLLGARVVIEFHEVLDTGEMNIPVADAYVRVLSPVLLRLVDGFVVHNEYDRQELRERYALGDRPVAMIPHGPYDQYAGREVVSGAGAPAEPDGFRLLYFGVIRPFKGLEDLVTAFNGLSAEDAARYRLTVVGETWEGWTLPAELIAASPHAERIEFVNRYVTDEEAAGFFASADAVVLPYHRSSSSGPAHLAMSHGLPLVITGVGGLVEAVAGYEGAIRIPPKDPGAIRDALESVLALEGRRFDDPHSWQTTVNRYSELFAELGVGPA
jgi:glycosyltransferase involved in cell wall biosynthesis